ncbi:MAG: CpsD/CapB family tyrosine-protein kinase [Clostridia bacterium]|nr:CpsD/CapB family tyrosine-protein kinase [Clostridia bacterium]
MNTEKNKFKNMLRPSNSKKEAEPSGSRKASFAVVESYKAIRTNLQFLLAQNDGKVVAFSSAGAGEGKSTTTVNVAITFSQLGGKVLLIDADLRKSSVHKKLKLENKDGLANVLVGFSRFEDAVEHINDSLDIMTAGPYPPNPSELLGSKQFAEFIEFCRKKYDYIFIDTPPINVVADALALAPVTDGMVFVVRDFVTPHEAFEHALEAAEFADVTVLGTIMNGVNAKKNRRYSYRKYAYGKKAGRYGYSRYGGYSGYNSYGSYGGYGYGYGGYDEAARRKSQDQKPE